MNIKLLPDHYILKRWTREAKFGTILDNQGEIQNSKSCNNIDLCLINLSLAYQAASDRNVVCWWTMHLIALVSN
jgi:hypothetical protein